MPNPAKILGLAVLLIALLAAAALWLRRAPPAAAITAQAAPAAVYVGGAACAACHAAEAAAWSGSQHAQAMQPATAQSVLGRFDGRSTGGARFFQINAGTNTGAKAGKDAGWFVHTEGGDGKPADFEVKYTFGVYPLQQYLVPFDDGRMQALNLAWDARPAAQGGQRWFDLHGDEHLAPGDPLHWTQPSQNWNYMCAACHSTHLQRNYDTAADRYHTTWSEPAVGCESCHGPGSRHLAWARHEPGSERFSDHGLAIVLNERQGVHWARNAADQPQRSAPLHSHREVETCAACHARANPLGTSVDPTGVLLDTHDPSLLDAGLYFPDGQQQAEVYIYGSFLQSRMYAHGVSCSDCHEPHGAKLRAEGNALCAQCHDAAKYDATTHTLHAANSAGAQCVACHMPTRTYMQIDARRDHSLRVPRPDLSLLYGTPNACDDCHKDKGAAWAADALRRAFGPPKPGTQHFAAALAAAGRGAPGAYEQLLQLAADETSPGIARATAVTALAAYPNDSTWQILRAAAADTDPLLRAAALQAALAFPPQQRAELALPLAEDQLRDVRIKAGRALAAVPDDLIGMEQRGVRDRAFAEYVSSEQASAERPEAHYNLGGIYAERGERERADAEYATALRLDPRFVPAYANRADLYRTQGREDLAAATLGAGLAAVPGDATLLHLSGLARVRAHDLPGALDLLRRAAHAAPDNAHFAYVYAVALNSSGQRAPALAEVERALSSQPYSPELLSAASVFARDAGNTEKAADYAQRYAAVVPEGAPAR